MQPDKLLSLRFTFSFFFFFFPLLIRERGSFVHEFLCDLNVQTSDTIVEINTWFGMIVEWFFVSWSFSLSRAVARKNIRTLVVTFYREYIMRFAQNILIIREYRLITLTLS